MLLSSCSELQSFCSIWMFSRRLEGLEAFGFLPGFSRSLQRKLDAELLLLFGRNMQRFGLNWELEASWRMLALGVILMIKPSSDRQFVVELVCKRMWRTPQVSVGFTGYPRWAKSWVLCERRCGVLILGGKGFWNNRCFWGDSEQLAMDECTVHMEVACQRPESRLELPRFERFAARAAEECCGAET